MALNERNTPANSKRFTCPDSIQSGDPVLVGVLPAVAITDYSSHDGKAGFQFDGAHALSVLAATVVSPLTGSAVQKGDAIYATGTLDATTNITHTLTLSKANGGTLFGHYWGDTDITSGETSTTAQVRLAGGD